MSHKRRVTKQEVADYFNKIAAPDYGVDARFFSAMGHRLVEEAKIASGARVLDVAAGRGAVLFPAAEQVGTRGQVVGIDLAEALVQATAAEIRRRGLTNTEIQRMDAEHLKFNDASFDAVLCGFALSFFPKLGRALSEFRRVLVPGGRFAATTFGTGDERMSWYEELLKRYGIARPIPVTQELDNAADIQAALNQAGFADVQVLAEVYDSIYADEEDWWARLWASGDRTALQGLEPETLKTFKAEAFEKIRAFKQFDGIHRPYHVLFALGNKPYRESR